MKKKLFVVVDMVNGFVNFGALHDPYINRIVPGIKNLTEQFKKFYQEHYEEYDEIVVVGCCTDICVTDFATSLAKFHETNGINTPITVPMDLVETFDGPNHDRNVMNEVGFENLRKAGVNLVETYASRKEKQYTL